MKKILALVIMSTAACSGRSTMTPVRGPTVTAEDLRRRMPPVPEKEARTVREGSFPSISRECDEAYVTSSLDGSFTSPGRIQRMYHVAVTECGTPPSEHKDILVVYEGGGEVWRTTGYQPVRAVDVDGDGQDEWVEVHSRCDDECETAAEVYSMKGGTAHLVEGTKRR